MPIKKNCCAPDAKERVEPQQKRTFNTNDSISNKGCNSESKLNNLIHGYLKALDNLIPESQKVTNNTTKLAKVEEIVNLALHIKVPTQEICSEKSCLLIVTKALELYYIPKLLEKKDNFNLTTKAEVLEKKMLS
ncbi:32966_t:CDS:2 [Gigaspora margarita]|uniref:32966_t:CDS:1 n=1 Tax=Gigaspora margarita TaxID=4874 RepID=A0ABN7UEV3_GIGMA|nr:32966_t:CDS:2 [Gigaspora margarita]